MSQVYSLHDSWQMQRSSPNSLDLNNLDLDELFDILCYRNVRSLYDMKLAFRRTGHFDLKYRLFGYELQFQIYSCICVSENVFSSLFFFLQSQFTKWKTFNMYRENRMSCRIIENVFEKFANCLLFHSCLISPFVC